MTQYWVGGGHKVWLLDVVVGAATVFAVIPIIRSWMVMGGGGGVNFEISHSKIIMILTAAMLAV